MIDADLRHNPAWVNPSSQFPKDHTMPNLFPATLLACSLLLVACQPQTASDARATEASAATPAQPETATVSSPAAATDSAAQELAAAGTSATADDGTQILRINTALGSVDCSDRHVEVFSVQAELSFTGQCRELYFLGENTRASVESAEMVQVVANNVALTIAAPLAELRQLGDGGEHRVGVVSGEVYVQGSNNQIHAQSLGELRLTGDRNRVHWTTGPRDIGDLGTGNVAGAAQ
jgi:hypothetical protein